MNERGPDSKLIGAMYDQQSAEYSDFAESPLSFSWRYIERPALKRYLEGVVTPSSKVLDVGTGTGRVIELLLEMGVSQQNVIGIDVSNRLLEASQLKFPEATFIHSSIEDLRLPPASFDLVTANMVFHYLDNEMLLKSLDNIYRMLKVEGKLCFLNTHPDRSEDSKRGENNDQWIKELTPWGQEIFIFNRDPYSLVDITDFSGFGFVKGWETLEISDEGKDDPEYKRYSGRSARAGYLWRKKSFRQKYLMWEETRNLLSQYKST